MKPLIKYAGGKTDLLPMIKKYVPLGFKYRFIEPFVGGGALFFDLEKKNSIINDFDKDLMEFYGNIVKSTPFLVMFEQAIDMWELLQNHASAIVGLLSVVDSSHNERELRKYWNTLELPSVFYKPILEFMINGVERQRKTIEKKREGKTVYFRRGIVGSFFYFFRSLYIIHQPMRSVRYFVLKELAYAGMSRYSNDGKFNVPFGGAYDKKNLRDKFDKCKEAGELLGSAERYNMRFEEFFNVIDIQPNDFVFLDPPYLTTFKNYGNNEFTETDHERLSWDVARLPCKFLLVIQDNPKIREFYKDFTIDTINGGAYRFNIKNRFNRNVNYLFIHP